MRRSRQLVIIDQLDENWMHGEIAEYSKILVNLILCAQNINNSEIYTDKLKVVVFLRADIYETLRFNDKTRSTKTVLLKLNGTTTLWTA